MMHVTSLIKSSSMAIGLVITIALLGYYIIPPYVFVAPGYSIYVAGIVDHKSIGRGYSDGVFHKWYTVSIRLFDDDPINQIREGETLGYIVTRDEWEMVEWGDTVKIKSLPDMKAEIVELFPSLKLPKWHPLSGSASPISIEISTNKTVYETGEKVKFTVIVKNAPEEKEWNGPFIPLNLTLFKTPKFWVFRDGEMIFASQNTSGLQEIILQPKQELRLNFDWQITDDLPPGVYYVRAYLGYFSEDEEMTLTCTTMIGIES